MIASVEVAEPTSAAARAASQFAGPRTCAGSRSASTTSTARQVATPRLARLNTSLIPVCRRWSTSAAPLPTTWAVTTCAGSANSSPMTSGISAREYEWVSLRNS